MIRVGTEFHEERRVAARLEHLGLPDNYAPRLRDFVVVRSRLRPKSSAMFIGYQFVQCGIEHIRDICCTKGVRGLVDGYMPPTEIDRWRAAEDEKGFVDLEVLEGRKFSEGDKVRAHYAGPFHGHVGKFAGKTADQRLRVLFAILGGERLLVLPPGSLVAA